MIKGSDFPGILSRTVSYASSGASLAGPWGAVAGAAVGLGAGLINADAQNSVKKKYTTTHSIEGNNPYSGIVQGLPGAKRVKDITETTEQTKGAQATQKAIGILDMGVSAAGLFGKPKDDVNNNSYQPDQKLIKSMVQPMVDKTTDAVIPSLGSFSLDSGTINTNHLHKWEQMMKNASKMFENQSFID